jgi:BolA protein
MSERADRIRSALNQSLSPERIELGDDSAAHAGHAGAIQSGGGHFSVYIVAEAFEGKSQVRRHQMIYQALGDLMQTDIHALVIKALTPSELP